MHNATLAHDRSALLSNKVTIVCILKHKTDTKIWLSLVKLLVKAWLYEKPNLEMCVLSGTKLMSLALHDVPIAWFSNAASISSSSSSSTSSSSSSSPSSSDSSSPVPCNDSSPPGPVSSSCVQVCRPWRWAAQAAYLTPQLTASAGLGCALICSNHYAHIIGQVMQT